MNSGKDCRNEPVAWNGLIIHLSVIDNKLSMFWNKFLNVLLILKIQDQ